jgi:DnaB-like helicase N terminal domain/AAA domain
MKAIGAFRKPQPPPDVQQTPPHDANAEMAVLSSIMVFQGQAISKCVEAGVRPDWFFVPAHQTIFQDLLDVYDGGGKIELIAFTNRLRTKGLLAAIGGAHAVTDIQLFLDKIHNFAPTTADLPDRIELVRAAYVRRQIIAGAAFDARRAIDPDPNVDMDAVLDEIASRAASLRSLHGGNHKISFRSPSEILAMPRNRFANFLGDWLLGVALSLVLAGIGGIGKSRLLLQLLFALILERAWCGIETHHTKGKPWLLIQTQNSNQRLQDDLEPLKKYAGADWSLVEKNLLIHTLETDRDLMLHLSEPENVRLLEREIRAFSPIGVAVDPLNEVAIGDLSKDVDMMATCRALGHLCRAGNPDRAIVIATHALTGLAGMKKAFGFEAAGFGRNSKVLQTWTRAAINVVPGTEDSNEILVLACGKNNNGKMFSPFAVRFNDDTKLYEPEPDFDISGFRQHLEQPKKRQLFPAEVVAEINWPKRELDKKQLATAIQAETGCSEPTAYRMIDAAVARHLIRFSKITKIYAKK